MKKHMRDRVNGLANADFVADFADDGDHVSDTNDPNFESELLILVSSSHKEYLTMV